MNIAKLVPLAIAVTDDRTDDAAVKLLMSPAANSEP
jgi:hypothetical protein